ncbi:MAG: hypothetical protein FWE54_02715 [Methanimicrococcus sp.]|nr:hypothetical protein [Methanimicrococcus sp.]
MNMSMNTKTAVISFALFLVIIGGVLCIAIIGSSDRFDNGVLNDSEKVTLEIKKDTVSDKGLTIIIINKSQKDYIFGEYGYYVEKEINGSWYPLPFVSGSFSYSDIARMLNKNSTAEKEINWERVYGSLDAGNYRISKDIGYLAPGDNYNFYISAEFVID